MHTDALENALLAVTGLTRLKLEYEWDPNITSYEGNYGAVYDWEDFANAVAQLTELGCVLCQADCQYNVAPLCGYESGKMGD